MTDGNDSGNAGMTQGSTQASAQAYAIVSNMPGYLPVSEDRVVAIGEDDAARAMRDEVDRHLDYAVESEQMTDDEASSDLAALDSSIRDGDIQYRIRVDGGQSWPLPEINLVVNCIPIDSDDLTDEERDYLGMDD